MANSAVTRPVTETARTARGRRSVIFYGWAGFAAQLLFLVGAVVFVIIGSSFQRSAIEAFSRAQRLQLTNQAIQGDLLDAQRVQLSSSPRRTG